jgi:RND family efflux transporter MFP subunit
MTAIKPWNQDWSQPDPPHDSEAIIGPGNAAGPELSPSQKVCRAMLRHKLRTGTLSLIAFMGILVAAGGLAVSLHANGCPDANPPSPPGDSEAQAAGPDEQAQHNVAAKVPHPVAISRPVWREAARYQEFKGLLQARQAVEVRAAVPGSVDKVCFKTGAQVQKGDVLFELDSRLAQAEVPVVKANLALAQTEVMQSDADLAEIRTKTASPEEVAKATLRASAAQADFKKAAIELDRAKFELQATKVRAPISGQVGRSLVVPDDVAGTARVLTMVTSIDPIGLNFDMDQQIFLQCQRLLRDKQVKGPGSSLHMGLAGENGFPHEGTLDGFDGHANAQSGTVRARGIFPNPGGLMLPGMFARVRMTFGPPRAVLEIPDEAILSDQGRKYVLVLDSRNVAERRPVTLGHKDQDMRIIEKGLRAEDRVIITGLRNIHPGDRVEPRNVERPTAP